MGGNSSGVSRLAGALRDCMYPESLDNFAWSAWDKIMKEK